MKLLIITQSVDRRDTTLGFFHRWIEEFSKRVEKVEVICFYKGQYDLPQNVSVYSLGKEQVEARSTKHEVRGGKIKYVLNFYKYIWRLRNDYDVVFVHMNQEYVVLAGIFWRMWNKKVLFWRNHPHGDFLTRIAVLFSDKVFCTSTHSFTARYSKTEIMPAGIDTNIFKKNSEITREKNSLLVFSRIAPIKKIELAIDTFVELRSKGISASLSIIGDALPKNQGYLETLKDRAEIAGVGDKVKFEKGVPFIEVPAVFQSHDLFLNFTPSGSFDKMIIEALACGTKVLVLNQSMKNILPDGSITDGDIADIVRKADKLLTFDVSQSAEYAERAREVVYKQSLDMLMDKLFKCIPLEIHGNKKM